MGKKRKRSKSPSDEVTDLLGRLTKVLRRHKKKKHRSRSRSKHSSEKSTPRRSEERLRSDSSYSRSRSSSPSGSKPRGSPVRSASPALDLTTSALVTIQPPPSDAEVPDKVLPAEIAKLMDERSLSNTVSGPKLYSAFSAYWTSVTRKGLATETWDKLVAKYPLPENCRFWEPPKRNPELSSVVNENLRTRDERIVTKQVRLGAGLSAASKATQELIALNIPETVSIIDQWLDAITNFSGHFFAESEVRRNCILQKVHDDLKDTVAKTEIDDYLFGTDLAEKVKAAKSLSHSAAELKAPLLKPVPKNDRAPPRRPAFNPQYQGGLGGQKQPYRQSRPPQKQKSSTVGTSRSYSKERYKDRKPSNNRSSNNKYSSKKR